MTGRERFLIALNNGKPDRMPCQVHSWMDYYLKTYLKGADQFEAYDYFGMDPVIYTGPNFMWNEKTFSNWNIDRKNLGEDKDGCFHWHETITTPKGILTHKGSYNKFTAWETEHLIKNENDFELWKEFAPMPVGVDWSPVRNAKEMIGDKGITRGAFFDFGQGSPWQSFSTVLFGTEQAIMECYDKPDWVHYIMQTMLDKKLKVIEMADKIELDLVETGGGGGSSTVISPNFHKEFCLPYDIIQHAALRDKGTKSVYHLCGGLMPLLEIVAENGADGLETMTPKEMGGDCDLAEATRRVGDKLFFIGGFDQNSGFEQGNPKLIKKMVFDCHSKCPDGGYICSPSDHFFFGNLENIKAFVAAAKECTY